MSHSDVLSEFESMRAGLTCVVVIIALITTSASKAAGPYRVWHTNVVATPLTQRLKLASTKSNVPLLGPLRGSGILLQPTNVSRRRSVGVFFLSKHSLANSLFHIKTNFLHRVDFLG